jgi:hypothetical protein
MKKSRRRREPNPLSIRSVCQYVHKVDDSLEFIKLSGTAIIIRLLLPSQAFLFETVFLMY